MGLVAAHRCGYVPRVRRGLLRLGPVEYTAIAVMVAVIAYTGWVAWDVRTDRPAAAPRTSSAQPGTPTPSVQVAAPGVPSGPPSLDDFRTAASTARTILVIGDSTGAGRGAWVDLV